MHQFDLEKHGEFRAEPFMPSIVSKMEGEIAWIENRLRENRERFADEPQIDAGDPQLSEGVFESDDTETQQPTSTSTQ